MDDFARHEAIPTPTVLTIEAIGIWKCPCFSPSLALKKYLCLASKVGDTKRMMGKWLRSQTCGGHAPAADGYGVLGGSRARHV